MAKNFLDLSGLSNFLDNLKELFSQSGHKHTVNDLTDYAVDSSLSATSTNPIQNKIVNQALLAFSTDMDNVESNINTLSDQLTDHENNANLHVSTTEQTHWDAAYTHSQSTHVSVADSVTSTSTTTAATSKNVKQAYDLANTANTAVGTLNDEFDDHVADTTAHMTSTQKSQLSTAYNHSQATHARTDATKVAKSNTNGNILINGTETVVYTHPTGTNPHGTTKTDIGLGNVDNTSDANKPVSTAQKAAIDAVQSNVNTLSDEFNDHVDNADIHFTAAERTKLSGIATGANKYTHPNSGVTAGTYKSVTVNAAGHVTGGTNPTTLSGFGITDAYTTSQVDSKIATSLSSAKTYADGLIDEIMGEGAADTLNTIGEISAAIEENQDAVDLLNTAIGNKVDKVSGKGLSTNDYTTTEKTKLAGIATGAEVNQNAFSNIIVGSTTVAADSKTDSVTFTGENITITGDTTNDKINFVVPTGSTSAKGIVQLTNSTSSTSTTTAATPNSVKSAYDLANTAKTTADEKSDKGHKHTVSEITDLTATATELNYMDGVTSAVQTQLDGKAASGHTHNYAGSSSAGGAATSANKVNSSLTVKLNSGTTEGTNMFTFNGSAAKTVNITPSGIGAAASSHTHDDRYYTEAEIDSKVSTLNTAINGKAASSHTHDAATTSAAGLMSATDKAKLDGIASGANAYSLPAATSSTLGGVKVGSNISVSSGTISVPTASGTQAGVTIVYPAANCTTFSSDSGTVTPLAVQKGAKQFAITRPSSSTNKAITRYSNTTGDVQDSKIIIEDVTNTKDSSLKAQVIAIPAEGGKKMVYGYCTDQVDGTSFIGGVFDADATSYPYNQGLAIGGTSGNLLWKGAKVATTSDLSGYSTTSHTHNYAGSSSAGGAATSAVTLSGLTATVSELNYVDGVTSNIQTQLNGKIGRTSVINVTLSASGWSSTAPYTQTVTASGLTANDVPLIGCGNPSSLTSANYKALNKAFAMVNRVTTGANQITAYCYTSKPTTDIPLFIKI